MPSENFNWVQAMSECNLSSVFETLKVQVANDVALRKEQLKAQGANYSFDYIPNGNNFIVAAVGNNVSGNAVKFRLTDAAISVDGPDDQRLFYAELTLNDDGECRVLINGEEEKDLWQLRKLALGNLLFRSPWKR